MITKDSLKKNEFRHPFYLSYVILLSIMGRGQYENRRKRFRDGEEENGEAHPKLQVLPVADLPEDYAGEIEDGATYLALAK